MSFSSAFLDKIKTSVKISDIVSRHVNWDPKKSNLSKKDFWAPCPFHKEKTASFHVDDTKGFYYCFGCQAKGNIFSFLKEMEGVSFFDAVKLLSEKAGIPLEIDIKSETLTIVVKVSASHLEILIMDLKDGKLLNQYSVKQKKSLYNERK